MMMKMMMMTTLYSFHRCFLAKDRLKLIDQNRYDEHSKQRRFQRQNYTVQAGNKYKYLYRLYFYIKNFTVREVLQGSYCILYSKFPDSKSHLFPKNHRERLRYKRKKNTHFILTSCLLFDY